MLRLSTGVAVATTSPDAYRRQHGAHASHRLPPRCLSSAWLGGPIYSSDLDRRQRRRREVGGPRRCITRMGKTAQDGPFTPVVYLVRNQMGTKSFNQLRGKAISLHSQVIKEFGKNIGADNKQIQGLIRVAKKNGEKLGFLS